MLPWVEYRSPASQQVIHITGGYRQVVNLRRSGQKAVDDRQWCPALQTFTLHSALPQAGRVP